MFSCHVAAKEILLSSLLNGKDKLLILKTSDTPRPIIWKGALGSKQEHRCVRLWDPWMLLIRFHIFFVNYLKMCGWNLLYAAMGNNWPYRKSTFDVHYSHSQYAHSLIYWIVYGPQTCHRACYIITSFTLHGQSTKWNKYIDSSEKGNFSVIKRKKKGKKSKKIRIDQIS